MVPAVGHRLKWAGLRLCEKNNKTKLKKIQKLFSSEIDEEAKAFIILVAGLSSRRDGAWETVGRHSLQMKLKLLVLPYRITKTEYLLIQATY